MKFSYLLLVKDRLPSRNGMKVVLRERYEKGEISKEEYDRMMNDLQRNKKMNL